MEILSWLMKVPAWLNAFDELQLPLWGVIAIIGLAMVAALFAFRELLGWLTKSHSVLDEVGELEINLMEQMNANARELREQVEALRDEVEELRRSLQPRRSTGQAATLLKTMDHAQTSAANGDKFSEHFNLSWMGPATPLPPISAEFRNSGTGATVPAPAPSPRDPSAARPRQFPLRRDPPELR
ncbi:MAG TPA: hypothetical protein PLZ57_02775 [Pseudobdellovibrionaceae bacterium]|nr:hypothetical protein [Pseudobdellovibrionaceae bacterium]